jgi:hypothetical protein
MLPLLFLPQLDTQERSEVMKKAAVFLVIVLLPILMVAQATPTPSSTNTAEFCNSLAQRFGGIPVPNGPVCDVVVVRKTPTIMGNDGMNLNQFTLMNSVLEFVKGASPNQVSVMGDFALLETELNPVLDLITQYGWKVTGNHNHMIGEKPKTTFLHWETQGNLDQIVDQINRAFDKTSIKK